VQLCIVHLLRASVNYVPWKVRKAAVGLQAVYRAATMAEAEQALEELEAKWKAYPSAGVAEELGADHAVFPLSAGDSARHLHHQ
jgi:transposase-like protein